MPAQQRAHRSQHVVAGVVAEGVVQMPEAHQIDEDDQRERPPVPAMTLHLAPFDLFEEPAVVAAGQRDGDRELLHLLVRGGQREVGAA